MEHIHPVFRDDVGKVDGHPQHIYRFYNGYGASVVINGHGDPELAVVRWPYETDVLFDFKVDTSTPVASDVVRVDAMVGDEVQKLLREIRALPTRYAPR